MLVNQSMPIVTLTISLKKNGPAPMSDACTTLSTAGPFGKSTGMDAKKLWNGAPDAAPGDPPEGR